MAGLLLALLLVAGGCQSPPQSPPVAGDPKIATRNNCYSLLHQLLDEEKDVSKLHIIKHEQPDVKTLVDQIAQTSGADEKFLEQCASNNPSIRLDDIQLPPGEVATRASISSTKEMALLGHTGEKFELNLLLTQSEAMNYGWHLAKVARENDSDAQRKQLLEGISNDMERLYKDVVALLAKKE